MEFGPILRAMKRSKVRFGLIALEVALTLAIVSNCVNMIRDAKRDLAKESGFDDDNIVSVASTPFAPEFKEDGYLDNGVREDLAALRRLPGVKAVSNTRFLPWQGGGSSTEVRIAGTKGEMLRTQVYNADEGTIPALGTNLIEGRNFTTDETLSETLRMRQLFAGTRERDDSGQPKEKVNQDVIVSQALAKLAFKDQPPLGKRLEDSDGDTYTVVGVIDKFYNPYGWPIHEYGFFFSGLSRSYGGGARYLVRCEPGKKAGVVAAVEKTLLEVNKGRLIRVRELTEVKSKNQAQSALLVRLLSIVIGALLFVTSLGIVGLTAFSVAERTRQIGTRRALGAQKADILRYFLLENGIVTSIGIVLGVAVTYALNVAMVQNVSASRMGLGLVVLGAMLLWAAGLAATFFPALRGARVAPAIATRNV